MIRADVFPTGPVDSDIFPHGDEEFTGDIPSGNRIYQIKLFEYNKLIFFVTKLKAGMDNSPSIRAKPCRQSLGIFL